MRGFEKFLSGWKYPKLRVPGVSDLNDGTRFQRSSLPPHFVFFRPFAFDVQVPDSL